VFEEKEDDKEEERSAGLQVCREVGVRGRVSCLPANSTFGLIGDLSSCALPKKKTAHAKAGSQKRQCYSSIPLWRDSDLSELPIRLVSI
jgi:hypothetical protein